MAKKVASKLPTAADERKLRSALLQAFLRTAVAEGKIDPRGKTEEQLRGEYGAYFKSMLAPGVTFAFTIDHRRSLLEQARSFSRDDEHQLACLVYATWVEHWLNSAIAHQAKRKGLEEGDVVTIIREASVRAKVSWLPKVLGLKPIAKHHVAAITKLTEARNAFVHYKWKMVNVEEDDPLTIGTVAALKFFEKTVRYLHRYESMHVYAKAQRGIKRVVS
jgi:hypothetical protein